MKPVAPVTSILMGAMYPYAAAGNGGETWGGYGSPMSYLLRVALPDVPGSLGRLASAIGSAGGNIDAIEIVERTADGRAVDDVFLAAEAGVMPDSIISACTALDGVDVLWISRYGAGSNLTRDLEVVEAMTAAPDAAADTLVDLAPATFVVDWAVRVRRDGDGVRLVHGSTAAPTEVDDDVAWPDLDVLRRDGRLELPERLSDLLVAGCPLGRDELVVVARRGGPPFLDSEIARLRHLAALAQSIGR